MASRVGVPVVVSGEAEMAGKPHRAAAVLAWTIDDVQNWLAALKFLEFLAPFLLHGVDGADLVAMEVDAIKILTNAPEKRCRALFKCVKDLQKRKRNPFGTNKGKLAAAVVLEKRKKSAAQRARAAAGGQRADSGLGALTGCGVTPSGTGTKEEDEELDEACYSDGSEDSLCGFNIPGLEPGAPPDAMPLPGPEGDGSLTFVRGSAHHPSSRPAMPLPGPEGDGSLTFVRGSAVASRPAMPLPPANEARAEGAGAEAGAEDDLSSSGAISFVFGSAVRPADEEDASSKPQGPAPAHRKATKRRAFVVSNDSDYSLPADAIVPGEAETRTFGTPVCAALPADDGEYAVVQTRNRDRTRRRAAKPAVAPAAEDAVSPPPRWTVDMVPPQPPTYTPDQGPGVRQGRGSSEADVAKGASPPSTRRALDLRASSPEARERLGTYLEVSGTESPARPTLTLAPSAVGLGGEKGLDEQPWFHGPVERAAAAAVLLSQDGAGDGHFLVRESKTSPGDYSLSVVLGGTPSHVRIKRTPDGGFRVGQADGTRRTFSSVCSMVEHYARHELALASGDRLRLDKPCERVAGAGGALALTVESEA